MMTANELDKEVPVPDRFANDLMDKIWQYLYQLKNKTISLYLVGYTPVIVLRLFTLANELMSAPLSGTAEKKLSMEKLKRRRSSAAGGGAKQSGAGATGTPQGGAGGKGGAGREAAGRTKNFDDCKSIFELKN